MEVADVIAIKTAAPLTSAPLKRHTELKLCILLTHSKRNKRTRTEDHTDDCDQEDPISVALI